ncbi:MAG: glycosyl transferase [Candidatus Magasanikbacteria bacterium]|nr:glycosyl transferase [Candidatus Magasanikbacteria bacterium]
MTPPKISIIIPVYNHAEELIPCCQSISKQTFQDFEVIIVDDGSTDAIENTLKECGKIFPSLQYQRIEHSGAPVARNTGFKLSRGEMVIFCDADVQMIPTMLEKMVRALSEHPSAAYVYSRFRFGFKKMAAPDFDSAILRVNNFIHTTSLIRREAFPGFDETLRRFQDWDLWLTLLEKGSVGIAIKEELFRVSTHYGKMSRWLPSFAYKLFPWLPTVRQYNKARAIIINKHHR